MSNKGILDPLIIELTNHCSRLDRMSNEFHAAVRAGKTPDVDVTAVMRDVGDAAELCVRILRDPTSKRSYLDGSVRALSFTLRAAHEVLDALILAHHPPSGESPSSPGSGASSVPAA